MKRQSRTEKTIRFPAASLPLESGLYQTSMTFDERSFDLERYYPDLPGAVKQAVEKRKIEFIAGRLCAQKALRAAGMDCLRFLPQAADGAAIWPDGVVGSITHTGGFASAVAASASCARSVGIDAEQIIVGKRLQAVKSMMAAWSGRERYDRGGAFDGSIFYTLLFSAKESLFKCLYPLVGPCFDYRDFEVCVDAADKTNPGRFSFKLVRNISREFRAGYAGGGHFLIRENRVHTLAQIRRH